MGALDVEAIDEQVAVILADASPAAARERIVAVAYPLAEYLAQRFAGRGEPLEDLIQVASLGLLKTIDRFDPERGVRFSTYATPTVLGELKRHFRDTGWALRVPRRLKDRALAVRATTETLTQELGRSPTAGEIGARADLSVEEVLEALEAGAGYTLESLDAPAADDRLGPAAVDDDALDLTERWASIASHLRALAPQQREILYLRFVRCLSQSQIGETIGYSQMHVSRMLRATLEQLRSMVQDEAVS